MLTSRSGLEHALNVVSSWYMGLNVDVQVVRLTCEEPITEHNVRVIEIPCERPFLRLVADMLCLVTSLTLMYEEVTVICDMSVVGTALMLTFPLISSLFQEKRANLKYVINVVKAGKLETCVLTSRDLCTLKLALSGKIGLDFIRRIYDSDRSPELCAEFEKLKLAKWTGMQCVPTDLMFLVYVIADMLSSLSGDRQCQS